MCLKQAQRQWFEALFHTSVSSNVFHKVLLGINAQCAECSCSVVRLEKVCMWWEHFSSESEAFSLWINEKERELEAVSSISSLESSEPTMEVRSLHHSSHLS